MTLIFVATDLHTCADCITNSKAGSDTVSPQMDKMGHKLPQSSDMRGYLERVSHRDGTLRTTEDLPPDRPPLLLLTATAQITSGGGPAILCHHGTLHSSTAPPATWEPIVMRRGPSGLAYLALFVSLLNICWRCRYWEYQLFTNYKKMFSGRPREKNKLSELWQSDVK